MSITDELRSWAEGDALRAGMALRIARDQALAIADRIDEEHERRISREAQLLVDAGKDRDFNYAKWLDCKQKVLQHKITIDELNEEVERLKDELMHCIELPKDADGEYIRIGDVLTDDAEFKSEGKVMRLMLENEGWMVVLGNGGWTEPSIHEWHHYYAPTVEDVLSEMLDAVDDDRYEQDRIIAEYASKLRLAGDAE